MLGPVISRPKLQTHTAFCRTTSFLATNLRFVGSEEEDGILVGRWFDSSFGKFVNLKKREAETITNQ